MASNQFILLHADLAVQRNSLKINTLIKSGSSHNIWSFVTFWVMKTNLLLEEVQKRKKCAPYWYVIDFCSSENNKAQRWIGRGSMYGYYTTWCDDNMCADVVLCTIFKVEHTKVSQILPYRFTARFKALLDHLAASLHYHLAARIK